VLKRDGLLVDIVGLKYETGELIEVLRSFEHEKVPKERRSKEVLSISCINLEVNSTAMYPLDDMGFLLELDPVYCCSGPKPAILGLKLVGQRRFRTLCSQNWES
jgi:hypothetical protein